MRIANGTDIPTAVHQLWVRGAPMAATASRPRVTEPRKTPPVAPSQPPEASPRFDAARHDALRAELEAARRRWLVEGDTDECVAEFAHALLALVRDAPPSS